MTHKRKPMPKTLDANATENLYEFLDFIDEQMGIIIENQNNLASMIGGADWRAQKRSQRMEKIQMFNFDQMNARIASIKDIAESVKAAYAGVVTQRDAAVAERDALKADDSADAEKLAAAEASLVAAEEMLKTLQAIVAGTPVVLPPAGGSTAGNAEPT